MSLVFIEAEEDTVLHQCIEILLGSFCDWIELVEIFLSAFVNEKVFHFLLAIDLLCKGRRPADEIIVVFTSEVDRALHPKGHPEVVVLKVKSEAGVVV